MVKHALDSSLDKLCVDALTVQIGSAELPLALLLFVSLYGEILRGRNSYALNLRSCNKRHWIALVESYLLIVEHSYLLISYSAEKLAKFRGPKSLMEEPLSS